jgi:hypothetical protein
MVDIALSLLGFVLFLCLFSEEFEKLLKRLRHWRERPGRGKYAVFLGVAVLATAGLGLILRSFVKFFSLLFVYE